MGWQHDPIVMPLCHGRVLGRVQSALGSLSSFGVTICDVHARQRMRMLFESHAGEQPSLWTSMVFRRSTSYCIKHIGLTGTMRLNRSQPSCRHALQHRNESLATSLICTFPTTACSIAYTLIPLHAPNDLKNIQKKVDYIQVECNGRPDPVIQREACE